MNRVATVALACLMVFGAACQKADADLAGEALTKAQAAQNAGKTDDAIKAYHQVLGYDPRSEVAYTNLGIIYRFASKPQIAEGYYRLALEVNPRSSGALFGLAVIRAAAGGLQEAAELYLREIAVDPNDAAAHYNLGIIYRALGRTAEGDAEIAKGRSLNPSLPPVSGTPAPATQAPRTPSPSPTTR